MNGDQKADDQKGLLDEVLADGAPGIESVLTAVRRARRVRTAKRMLFCAAMAACLLVSLKREVHPVVAVTEPTPVAPIVEQSPGPPAEETLRVERLNDQELLEMLDGMPVALASYPDGKQALMVIAK